MYICYFEEKVEKKFYCLGKSCIFATSIHEKEVFERLIKADVTQLVE